MTHPANDVTAAFERVVVLTWRLVWTILFVAGMSLLSLGIGLYHRPFPWTGVFTGVTLVISARLLQIAHGQFRRLSPLRPGTWLVPTAYTLYVVGALVLVLGISAVVVRASVRGEVVHPAEFAGHWVRLRSDGTWGDTLEYLIDGTVRGSVGHAVPDSTRWSVVRSRYGEAFCTRDATVHACHPFRLVGDTLVLGRISDPTFFRRVR